MRKAFVCVAVALAITLPSGPAAAEDLRAIPEMDRRTALTSVTPNYPFEARRAKRTGSGIVVFDLDPSTGRVTSTRMAQSTGHPELDEAIIETFKDARFRKGVPPRQKAAVSFLMSGVRTSNEYKVKARSMDEVLARFLGPGTVVEGPAPDYPRSPAWTNKSGSGVYELHAGKTGAVEEVRILKSSGDKTFDRVTVRTLRKWRLRRGPLVVELPLRFTLTPENYAVDVAR